MKQAEEPIIIDPARTALLLLHWQNELAAPGGKLAGEMLERLAVAQTVEHTQAVLQATRNKGMLIIYVNAGHRQDYPEVPAKRGPLMEQLADMGAMIRGTWGAKVIDDLKPMEDEILVNNYSTSAFCYTELELILRTKGITDLVLTGLVTNFVVESTARDATGRGFFIYTLSDCCHGFTDEMHHWSLTNILPAFGRILTSNEYITALGA